MEFGKNYYFEDILSKNSENPQSQIPGSSQACQRLMSSGFGYIQKIGNLKVFYHHGDRLQERSEQRRGKCWSYSLVQLKTNG